MDKETRKEYNKKYYEKNREDILSKACTQVICTLCGRHVSKYNLEKHKKKDICARFQESRKYDIERLKA
jgi:hypothetical protein